MITGVKQSQKTVVRLTGWVFSIILFMFMLFSAFLQITEFRPESRIFTLDTDSTCWPDTGKVIAIFSWNIGYAGMGQKMDFFYDGGKRTRQSKSMTLECLAEIKKLVGQYDTVPIMFLQEVDVYSRRSWNLDELTEISKVLPGHDKIFSKNYDCKFVPVPVCDPMGGVKSGLVTFSHPKPNSGEIRYYQSEFSWPQRLVMLKRCFILFRFSINEKELVVVNLHNSAYDSTGALRGRELSILDSVLKKEYEKGNFVVAGGDWNINPRGFDKKEIETRDIVVNSEPSFPDTILTGWQFVYDHQNPTERYSDIGYVKGETRTTILDFFVVSPNITVVGVETMDQQFKWSDHNPVVLEIKLGRNRSN